MPFEPGHFTQRLALTVSVFFAVRPVSRCLGTHLLFEPIHLDTSARGPTYERGFQRLVSGMRHAGNRAHVHNPCMITRNASSETWPGCTVIALGRYVGRMSSLLIRT